MNRCAYLDKNHTFTIEKKNIPTPQNDEVLVKIVANGICGSDIHFYQNGRLGNFVVTEPYIPGHEASGEVVKAGAGVTDVKIGDRVVIEPGIPCGRCDYCKSGRYNLCKSVIFLSAPPINGTFCDYISIRSDCVHKMPKELSFEYAALTEPAAVAVHAVNRARFRRGATAVVMGAGPIGLLTLQAFKAAGGGKVICTDGYDSRLEKARALGADETINIFKNSDELVDLGDVVFETAGSAKATSTLFKTARIGGSVVQVGWPAGNIVQMNIADFLDRELDYYGVNRYANAFPTAIEWIASGRIDVKSLITGTYTLDDIAEAFQYSSENPDKVIKTVVLN